MTRRLSIHFEVTFGKEATEEDEAQPGGDVYASTERRPPEDAEEARPIGFGRPIDRTNA